MADYFTLTLHGDPYTMGLQHGQQVSSLRPQIVAAMDARFRQLESDEPDARFEALVAATRALLEDSDAALLAMIHGQATALSLEFETLLRYNLIAFLRDDLLVRHSQAGAGSRPGGAAEPADGCTTWAAAGSATADGEPILAKNQPLQNVVRATPRSGYRYLHVGSAGCPGVYCAGINQAGLAVADTHVYSVDLGPGLPSYSLMMHILERCDCVPAALDFLRAVPRLGRNNLILADATGHLAVFEGGHSRYGLFETRDGAVVNTNHFCSDEMRDCFAAVDSPQARASSRGRYDLASRTLRAAGGRIDVALARRLMATHDGRQSSICCHPQPGSDAATISASIFMPARRQMLFCHGLPCQGRWDAYDV
jgi:isopenicillin-N N-acyltransferase-like protein